MADDPFQCWTATSSSTQECCYPCRIIQNRLEVTREQSSSPSSSVPRASSGPKCSSVLWRASPRGSEISLHSDTPFFFRSKPHFTDRSEVVDEHARASVPLFTSNKHQRWPTVVNQLRGRFTACTAQAGCEAGLLFIAALGHKQGPRKAYEESSPTWPNRSVRLQPVPRAFLQSLTGHVRELL